MSVPFDKLKETFEKFYPEYQSWVEANSDRFSPYKIGQGAFTMQEATVLLLEFSETIKIALKDEEQCLKHVSGQELNEINGELSAILNDIWRDLSPNDYGDFAGRIDRLIPYMRLFQFLSMEKMDEKRAHEIRHIDKNLSEIKRLQKSVNNIVNKVKSDSEDLRNLIESATEKNKQFDELFNERNNELNELFNEKNTELDELINENNQKMKILEALHIKANDYANQLNNYVGQIDNILKGANTQKSKIDEFVDLIQKREKNIDSQNVATEEYEAKLKDFSEKHESNMQEAESLIQKSREALKFSTASGLSAAFQVRQEKLEDKKVKRAWLIGGGIAVAGAIVIGVIIILFGKDTTIPNVIARTFIMMILIAVAIFCSRQYAKNRSFEEDYAYKATLVKSFPGLDEAFEQVGLRKEYADKLLDEILQDPQRARHDKESLIDSHPLIAELKKFLKNNETKTDKPK